MTEGALGAECIRGVEFILGAERIMGAEPREPLGDVGRLTLILGPEWLMAGGENDGRRCLGCCGWMALPGKGRSCLNKPSDRVVVLGGWILLPEGRSGFRPGLGVLAPGVARMVPRSLLRHALGALFDISMRWGPGLKCGRWILTVSRSTPRGVLAAFLPRFRAATFFTFMIGTGELIRPLTNLRAGPRWQFSPLLPRQVRG